MDPDNGQSPPHEDPAEELAALYGEALLKGEGPDLEGYAARLDEEPERRRFAVLATAGEYLLAIDQGQSPDLEALLARLPEGDDRRECREQIDNGLLARRHLHWQLAPGQTLSERYEILGEIGRGGMGVVYRARDSRLERTVALKVLNPRSLIRSPEDLERLLAESRSLAELQSPNIVKVYDVVASGAPRYIVLEYVRGVELATVIRRMRKRRAGAAGGRGPRRRAAWIAEAIGDGIPHQGDDLLADRSFWRCAARILARLARAVHHAHVHGITHRDLKPGNVLLRGRGDPILLDFGLAGPLGSEVDGEGIPGSMGYFAPEQLSGSEGTRDRRTDVYQLGLILYELLTLEPAFPGRDPEKIVQYVEAVRRGRFAPPREREPRLPRSLADVCLKSLETEPGRRYPDAARLAEDLEDFSRGRHPSYGSSSPVRRALGWMRYWGLDARVLLPAGVLAAVLLVFNAPDWLTWSPPEVQAEGYVHGTSAPVILSAGERLVEYDDLGVQVESGDGCWIYALSIFHSREEPFGSVPVDDHLVRPVRPFVLDGSSFEASAEPGPIELESGSHHLVCASIDREDNGMEGIFVIATASREPLLDEWLLEIQKLGQAGGLDRGIPWSQARGALDSLKATPRGGSPGRDLTREEWDRRYGGVDVARGDREGITGLKRAVSFEARYEVEADDEPR